MTVKQARFFIGTSHVPTAPPPLDPATVRRTRG